MINYEIIQWVGGIILAIFLFYEVYRMLKISEVPKDML